MYKITRGDNIQTAATYTQAEKIFNRIKRNKYPCGTFTRLYCDLGDGYQLMMISGKAIERS